VNHSSKNIKTVVVAAEDMMSGDGMKDTQETIVVTDMNLADMTVTRVVIVVIMVVRVVEVVNVAEDFENDFDGKNMN